MATVITNNKLKDPRCIDCFRRSYVRLFKKYKVQEHNQNLFLEKFNQIVEDSQNLSSPEIQRELSKTFCDLIGINDPFFEEKQESNKVALDIFNKWYPIVFAESDSFTTTLRLAIAGNIMDYGASDYFDIDSVIIKVLHAEFAIDHSCLLKDKIEEASNILYLGDNAGEIVFDKLFIEANMSDKVTYVVKGGAVLNDVTLKDAEEVGMKEVAQVITNGYDAPSTVLEKCSPEFIEHYNNADLIISKGQGNLEGLINQNDNRLFFLLMVKCDVIAELLNVEKGSFIVLNGGESFEK
ncbi:MAG: DUF89 family protein [Bacteroidales bacterium]|nr:DUF89 family protein [Bacteroidales bacterium]